MRALTFTSILVYVFSAFFITFYSTTSQANDQIEFSNTNIERTEHNGIVVEVLIHKSSETLTLKNNSSALNIINQETGGILPSRILTIKKHVARTGIIIIPSPDQYQRKKTLESIRQLLHLRPKEELIGIYVFTDRLRLVINFTADRTQLLRGVNSIENLQTEQTSSAALYNYHDFKGLVTLDSGATQYFRNTFIFGNKKPSYSLAKKFNALTPWLVTAVNTQTTKTSESIAHSVSKQIETNLETPIHQIAFCEPSSNIKVAISLNHSLLPIKLNSKIKKQNDPLCELDNVFRDHSFVPSQVHFEFNTQQKEIYNKIVQKISRVDFELSVKSSSDGVAHSATAHLRGQSTLRLCGRKSYSLELANGFPKNLLPNASSHHYFLMALCFDQMNIRSHTAYKLWQSLSLFPMRYRFIELFINGTSQGIYMILENPSTALVQKRSHTSSIIRRDFDLSINATHPQVKYSSTTETNASGDYINAFLGIDKIPEKKLSAVLEKSIDLEQYITHLATATILQNGDYVDEILFIKQESLSNDGLFIDRYQILKWDPDELFRPCHIAGQIAFKDPWGIAYCVESEVGKAILSHPVLYDRFVNKIEELFSDKLSKKKVSLALKHTTELTLKLLKSKGALMNISVPKSKKKQFLSVEEIKTLVRVTAQGIFRKYNNHRKTTLAKIQRYRKARNHQNHFNEKTKQHNKINLY